MSAMGIKPGRTQSPTPVLTRPDVGLLRWLRSMHYRYARSPQCR